MITVTKEKSIEDMHTGGDYLDLVAEVFKRYDWQREGFVRDELGRDVTPAHQDAVAFSLMGAIHRAECMIDYKGWSGEKHNKKQKLKRRAMYLLTWVTGVPPDVWNEYRCGSKADVFNIIDKAKRFEKIQMRKKERREAREKSHS